MRIAIPVVYRIDVQRLNKHQEPYTQVLKIKAVVEVEVAERAAASLPPAFELENGQGVTTVVRTDGERLFAPLQDRKGAPVTGERLAAESGTTERDACLPFGGVNQDALGKALDAVPEGETVVRNDLERVAEGLMAQARDLLVVDGAVWQACGEPIWRVDTRSDGRGGWELTIEPELLTRHAYAPTVFAADDLARAERYAQAVGGAAVKGVLTVHRPELVRYNGDDAALRHAAERALFAIGDFFDPEDPTIELFGDRKAKYADVTAAFDLLSGQIRRAQYRLGTDAAKVDDEYEAAMRRVAATLDEACIARLKADDDYGLSGESLEGIQVFHASLARWDSGRDA